MTRLNSTPAIAAAVLAMSVLPGTIGAQAPAASKNATTITIEVDPWLAAWRKEQSQSRIVRSNLRTLNDALEPYRMTYSDLSESERGGIRTAFADVLPGQRFTSYRLNTPQARAIVFLALGPARGRRDRCEHARQPEPAPIQAGEPTPPSWCDAALDSMSRSAAWIHTTILAVGRSSAARRSKSEELDDLRSMAERAREIVVSTPRCGCRLGDDADALLTSTREALDAVAASSVPAWMTLRGEQVQRIATLSSSVERFLLRCLSSR